MSLVVSFFHKNESKLLSKGQSDLTKELESFRLFLEEHPKKMKIILDLLENFGRESMIEKMESIERINLLLALEKKVDIQAIDFNKDAMRQIDDAIRSEPDLEIQHTLNELKTDLIPLLSILQEIRNTIQAQGRIVKTLRRDPESKHIHEYLHELSRLCAVEMNLLGYNDGGFDAFEGKQTYNRMRELHTKLEKVIDSKISRRKFLVTAAATGVSALVLMPNKVDNPELRKKVILSCQQRTQSFLKYIHSSQGKADIEEGNLFSIFERMPVFSSQDEAVMLQSDPSHYLNNNAHPSIQINSPSFLQKGNGALLKNGLVTAAHVVEYFDNVHTDLDRDLGFIRNYKAKGAVLSRLLNENDVRGNLVRIIGYDSHAFNFIPDFQSTKGRVKVVSGIPIKLNAKLIEPYVSAFPLFFKRFNLEGMYTFRVPKEIHENLSRMSGSPVVSDTSLGLGGIIHAAGYAVHPKTGKEYFYVLLSNPTQIRSLIESAK